jgi:hypothetical protein
VHGLVWHALHSSVLDLGRVSWFLVTDCFGFGEGCGKNKKNKKKKKGFAGDDGLVGRGFGRRSSSYVDSVASLRE